MLIRNNIERRALIGSLAIIAVAPTMITSPPAPTPLEEATQAFRAAWLQRLLDRAREAETGVSDPACPAVVNAMGFLFKLRKLAGSEDEFKRCDQQAIAGAEADYREIYPNLEDCPVYRRLALLGEECALLIMRHNRLTASLPRR